MKEISNQEQYEKSIKNKQHLVLFIRIMIFVVFFLIWEMASDFKWIDSFFFSSPKRVFLLCKEMIVDGSLVFHLKYTMFEIIVSFFFVVLLSLIIAMILWMFPTSAKISEPYLILLNSLPKSAMAPLFIVWLGANTKTIIVAGLSVAIFGSIINLYTGFLQTDAEKIKLIYTLGGTKKDVFCKVVFPSNIPTLLSTIKVDIGLSLVGVIIGEFLAARHGLGYLIIYGSEVFKMDLVIMSIILLCMIAAILYFFICQIEKSIIKTR